MLSDRQGCLLRAIWFDACIHKHANPDWQIKSHKSYLAWIDLIELLQPSNPLVLSKRMRVRLKQSALMQNANVLLAFREWLYSL